MLKLIVDNTPLLNGNILSQEFETQLSSLNDLFLADFQEFSQNLYIFRTKDFDHKLSCEMTLEVKEGFAYAERDSENRRFVPIVACSFPSINVQKLNEKIGANTYLQRILVIQFQLKILEQLFLFCEEKSAINLILTIHDASLGSLEIYHHFLISEEQITTSRGEQTQIVIPTDASTYDRLVDFMNKTNKDFRTTLWQGQNANPAFRAYLKEHSLMAI